MGLGTIWSLLRRVPSGVWAAIAALFAFAVRYGKVCYNIWLTWRAVQDAGTKPAGREEEPGTPDAHNYTQPANVTVANAEQQHDVPVGTATETVTTINIQGTLKPVKPQDAESQGPSSTDDLISAVDQAIKDADKE